MGVLVKCVEFEMIVIVDDYNDYVSVFKFSLFEVYVYENILIGSEVVCFLVIDDDEGSNVEVMFSVVVGCGDGSFEINFRNGIFCIIWFLDREIIFNYIVVVWVFDWGVLFMFVDWDLVIFLCDVNDNMFIFFEFFYMRYVIEN